MKEAIIEQVFKQIIESLKDKAGRYATLKAHIDTGFVVNCLSRDVDEDKFFGDSVFIIDKLFFARSNEDYFKQSRKCVEIYLKMYFSDAMRCDSVKHFLDNIFDGFMVLGKRESNNTVIES